MVHEVHRPVCVLGYVGRRLSERDCGLSDREIADGVLHMPMDEILEQGMRLYEQRATHLERARRLARRESRRPRWVNPVSGDVPEGLPRSVLTADYRPSIIVSFY